MTCLDAALEYREAGLVPIPVGRDKRPLIPSWKPYQTEMPSEDTIRAWWTLWPDANVALVMGRGTFAVDVDGPEGEAALKLVGIDISEHPRSKTARGYHVFLKGNVPDKIGLLPKVDIRGVGYVVAPPSIHESGHVYRWERAIEGVLRPGPQKLYDLIGSTPRTEGARTVGGQDWLVPALSGVGEGGRDVTCTRIAGYLLGKRVQQDAVEAILQTWAEQCQPPFPADQVTKCVESIAKREVPDEETPTPTPLAEAITTVLQGIGKPRPVVAKTEFPILDLLLDGGLDGGTLTYIGAWTSVGKSSFIAQVARRVARKRGVLFVTLEMSIDAIVRRFLCQESKVAMSAIKQADVVPLSDIQQKMLQYGAAQLLPAQLWLTTDPRTPGQLERTLDSFQPGTLGAVVIDYLQKMRTDSPIHHVRERISELSGDLKRLSVKYNLPFIVVSSLRRLDQQQQLREPTLTDLKESGDLEYDADNVIFLHRPDLNKGNTDLILAKQRDGAVGRTKLNFDAPRVTFEEVQH